MQKGFSGGTGGEELVLQSRIRETQVRSLVWEGPLGGRHGNPLQYSCLENPMDGGARRAIVHGVTKSCHEATEATQLKRLSTAQTQKLLLRENSRRLGLDRSVWMWWFWGAMETFRRWRQPGLGICVWSSEGRSEWRNRWECVWPVG